MGNLRTPLEQFRLDNLLERKDIAEFLSVSRTFVGNICTGKNRLPELQKQRLLKNDRGWDTTALEKPDEPEEIVLNEKSMEMLRDIMATIESMSESFNSLKELIRIKDQQIGQLTGIITNMAEKK